jgi:hypothetical protein
VSCPPTPACFAITRPTGMPPTSPPAHHVYAGRHPALHGVARTPDLGGIKAGGADEEGRVRVTCSQ